MQKAILIMGSKSDLEFAEKIRTALSSYSVQCEMRIASAHRTPEHLLQVLRNYASSGDQIVAITIAGLSDALSGVVAAQRLFPVVACPPDIEKYEFPKIFSSAFTPSDVPVALVTDPVKAAHFVAQIFALSDKKVADSISKKLAEKKGQILNEDSQLVSESGQKS
ncbi:MAG TPA: AIR carboxylase family protein [Nitrososphaerales archaeon]|nr:AIR carboxylase family protein [Nitrososphaerales archaeon]